MDGGPGGWRPDGDPTYGTDVEAARQAVERAEQSGLIDQPFDDASVPMPIDDASDPPDADNGNDLDTPLERFLKMAVAQSGDPYDSDSSANIVNNPNPVELECSELTEWAGMNAGVKLATTSYLQFFQMEDANAITSVDEALRTPGALLFTFDPPPVRGGGRPPKAHVAVSLATAARSRRWARSTASRSPTPTPTAGPTRRSSPSSAASGRHGRRDDVGRARRRRGDDALRHADGPDAVRRRRPTGPSRRRAARRRRHRAPDPLAEAPRPTGRCRHRRDMLPDHFETKYALDPNDPDTDGDGITDGYELIVLGTEADLADSDFDGIGDGLELSYGLDPTKADNPDVDQPLEAPTTSRSTPTATASPIGARSWPAPMPTTPTPTATASSTATSSSTTPTR